MATVLGRYNEIDDLGGGRFRLEQHLKDHAHLHNGYWRRNNNLWVNSGITTRPHLIDTAPMMVTVDDEGHRRIHPTKDPNRYIEIGTPMVFVGGQWRKVGFTSATRQGNTIKWSRSQADLSIAMGGHFVNWECELKGGYNPGQIALPVKLTGLTRTGDTIYADGVPVMFLNKPVMRDAANPFDVRPITYTFTNLQGQPYLLLTLPSLVGMIRPVIDPTLTLQPDATDGIDALIDTSSSGVMNAGINSNILSGKYAGQTYRTLIKFDLSSLPENAIISSSYLALYCNTNYSTAGNSATHAVYRQKRAWVEGTRVYNNDSPATGVTWNRYDTTNSWQTAGGFGANDCEQSDIGSRDFTDAETLNVFKNILLTPTTKTALDLGNGFMLKSTNEASINMYQFSSSDVATADQRPKLVIEYTVSTAIKDFIGGGYILVPR